MFTKNITLQQAISGTQFTIFSEGHFLKVKIPAFTCDGQVIRLKKSSVLGEELFIQLRILDNPRFCIDEADIRGTLIVDTVDALRGTQLMYEGPAGRTLPVTVSAGARDGDELRIVNEGFVKDGKRGDLILELRTSVPEEILTARNKMRNRGHGFLLN